MSRLTPLIAAFFLLLGSQMSWAAPADSPEPRVILNMRKAKGLAYSPTPEYPKEALRKHWGGFGIFEVQFRRDGLPSAVFGWTNQSRLPCGNGGHGKVTGRS